MHSLFATVHKDTHTYSHTQSLAYSWCHYTKSGSYSRSKLKKMFDFPHIVTLLMTRCLNNYKHNWHFQINSVADTRHAVSRQMKVLISRKGRDAPVTTFLSCPTDFLMRQLCWMMLEENLPRYNLRITLAPRSDYLCCCFQITLCGELFSNEWQGPERGRWQ